MKNDSNLFFLCSLIEFIGRQQRQKRSEVVRALGEKVLRHIYKYGDVLHCEPIEKTAYEFISSGSIPTGAFDNVAGCKYEVPDYWTIGEVYERLIEDLCGYDLIKTLVEVYTSWIDDAISNYNSDFYYQPRDYISECYRAGEII
ncbi:MAG: hypothetical protein NC123_06225 [Butyrivibrio sp.]|nr:hypothetical protein [Acetatifactor muris]MCM1559125.1 hypothetical protein [Butyrivibrio sp.]